MQISLVITVLNEIKTIRCLLAGIENFSEFPDEIVFVDGGSKDGTLELLYEWQQRVQRLQRFKNTTLQILQKRGNISVGRNEGILRASHDWIAITDAGCTPNHDWITRLSAPVAKFSKLTKNNPPKSGKDIPIFAGFYRGNPKSPFEHAVVPFVLVSPENVDPKTFLPATRSMLVHKKTWKELGGFREDLRVSEDYFFALQAVKQEIPILFVPKAIVLWRPRSNIFSFCKMVYLHAYYDQVAGIRRPKVTLIFVRYFIAILLVLIAFLFTNQTITNLLIASGIVGYSAWATLKHWHHWPQKGWYYLPILQWASDVAVMTGTGVRLVRSTCQDRVYLSESKYETN
jgi:glycosyltransferase involved in cell wall biosynthesis